MDASNGHVPDRTVRGDTQTRTDPDSRSAFTPKGAAPSAWIAGSHISFTALAQGVYFVTTGIWPILHLRSFEAVTGAKVDRWLVKTFGALIGSVGGALIVGAVEVPRSRTLRALGVGSAAALALAEVIYVGKGRIAKVYLLDTLVQLATAGAWLLEEQAHRDTRGTDVPSAAPWDSRHLTANGARGSTPQ